jgi:hypothetical protein
MFRIGDIVLRVEHSKTISRMLNWSLNGKNIWLRDNFKNIKFCIRL